MLLTYPDVIVLIKINFILSVTCSSSTASIVIIITIIQPILLLLLFELSVQQCFKALFRIKSQTFQFTQLTHRELPFLES